MKDNISIWLEQMIDENLEMEKGGVGGYEYRNVADQIFSYIQKEVSQINDFNKILDTKLEIPESLTAQIDMFQNLKIIISFEPKNGSSFGRGGSEVQINDEIINGKLKNGFISITTKIDPQTSLVIPYSFYNNFFHEITHEVEHLERIKRSQKQYQSPKERSLAAKLTVDYYYNEILRLQRSENIDLRNFAVIFYRLWIDTERNALATSVYSFLKSIQVHKSNIYQLINQSQAGKFINDVYAVLDDFNDIDDIQIWSIIKKHTQCPFSDTEKIKKHFIKKTINYLHRLENKIKQIINTYLSEFDEQHS